MYVCIVCFITFLAIYQADPVHEASFEKFFIESIEQYKDAITSLSSLSASLCYNLGLDYGGSVTEVSTFEVD